ncbi:MAG TPA: helix-turn-helix domain-containing protein [Polyangiaceae bacterium]|nr:helix-turn-helix domain-containing protein [Polyangiaceae bacterium]
MISKETEAEVLRLYHAEKWRIGTIAAQLGLHHTTVQRVLRQMGVELKAIVPRPSMADPFVPFLVQQLEKYPGLCASRLFEMVRERGYPGGADHFRREETNQGPTAKLPAVASRGAERHRPLAHHAYRHS